VRLTGRLLKTHPRAARFHTLALQAGELLCARDEQTFGKAGDLCGKCVLRTDQSLVRRLLSTHCLLTARPPLEDGRVLHIRKPSIPDAQQAKVFQNPGINWKAEVPPQKRFVKS